MKCFLLATALTLGGVQTANAQATWEVGQDITSEEGLGWGNLSFENDPFDYWTLESSKGSFTKTGSNLFEVYDGADVDLYQYVKLPAGKYSVECQAYYRCGNSWADDPSVFGTADWQDNALLYVQNGTYTLDDAAEKFEASRIFQSPLMPRLYPMQDEQLYVDEIKEGWDMSDGFYTVSGGAQVWGPCSVPGSKVWFEEGLYAPEETEDGVYYNHVDFWLAEDGYVRIGISKMAVRSADSFMATNFKLYYQGEVDPATAELIALQEEVQDLQNQLSNLCDKYVAEGSLYTLIVKEVEELQYETETKEQCQAAKALLSETYNKIKACVATYEKLVACLPAMNYLIDNTEYEGYEAFNAVFKKAVKSTDPEGNLENETLDFYENMYNELMSARGAYLMTQEKVNGAYNFSATINNAFLCDNEYTPVWNEDIKQYEFPFIEGISDELQPENTWANIQEKDYKEAKAEAGREEWIPIADNVSITQDKTAEGKWVINTTTWHGNGFDALTVQHGYIAIGGWTAEPTGNPEFLTQTITGLPNGYYSMSALLCNAGADVSPLQYVFIRTSETEEKANLTQKGNPWWGGDKSQWRSTVWQKLDTKMVQVTDGKVTIGSASDAFYAVTGFQLYYYGETPDFNGLFESYGQEVIQLYYDLVNGGEEAIGLWPGDIAAACAILDNIVEIGDIEDIENTAFIKTINSEEEYAAAIQTLQNAKAYITTAKAAIADFANTCDKFDKLQNANEGNDKVRSILDMAFATIAEIGSGENDTYKMAEAVAADYTGYNEYIALLNKAAAMNNAEVNAVIESQVAYLSENYAPRAKMDELLYALSSPYNAALIADLGNASPESPVEITHFLINPKFNEGNKGWNGDMGAGDFWTLEGVGEADEEGRYERMTNKEHIYTVERWNTNFDINQTLYAMPAGLYRLEVHAFYRDNGGAAGAYDNWWNKAGCSIEDWETKRAEIYANANSAYVTSIASITPEEMSHIAYINGWEEIDENGTMGPIAVQNVDAEEGKEYDYPWDTRVTADEEEGIYYYYPNSHYGAACRLFLNQDDYINVVETGLTEAGNLTVGIRNLDHIDNDWTCFDSFKLYYCGKTLPNAIQGIQSQSNGKAYYNLNGVRISAPHKGVNIVKTADGTVRKYIVK